MVKDLIERVEIFGETVIIFVRKLSLNPITKSIINQLIRSSTSIGANYYEAQGASSRKDFINKIYICKKEAIETQHWLRMLSTACPNNKEDLRKLWKEAHELGLIFSAILTKSKSKLIV